LEVWLAMSIEQEFAYNINTDEVIETLKKIKPNH